MTEDPRTAWLAALATWIPGAVASATPWLENLGTLLVVVATFVALAGGLLGLWLFKMIREREDVLAENVVAREEKMDDRFEKLDERFERLSEERERIESLITKALLNSEYLARQIAEVKAEAQRAHERLERGREAITRISTGLAELRAVVGLRPEPRRGDSDG